MIDDLPKGYTAGTTEAAFKKAGRQDLGIIFSDSPAVLAALFTKNLFCAAPVQICKKILASGQPVRAIVGNSGQANACTGEEGLENCREIQRIIAHDLEISPDEVLPISTGVIGQQFDMSKWRAALPQINLGTADALAFTSAIMTTDAFPKYRKRDMPLENGIIRLTVMAKGAGMICPNMATMLCVCLTDAVMDAGTWQRMFNFAVNKTFNRVSVDGDTSTNDTIVGLANGASGVALADETEKQQFQDALTSILDEVAYMLVQDGEGARRILHITVSGTETDKEAEQIARSIGNSQLVKTAIYGGDANWGRIINAVGYAGVRLDPQQVALKLCGIERFKNGQPVNNHLEEELTQALQAHDIHIDIVAGNGSGYFNLKTSDLGHEYVSLNADYRS